MKHLGDIVKINGATVPPVNVIIGGSPCQDLSLASGKRKGLVGERSSLFMEQIRIIKEMRKADESRNRTGKSIRPRFMVWENVPGAFSSGKGADFAAVLGETIKIVCPKAPNVPIPKNGWPTAGCITDVGGQWSIAWRVHDAQFWGVPQRRRRIALIADFGGITAPEILFERKSVSGNYTESGTTWKSITRDSKNSFDKTDSIVCLNDQGGSVMGLTENVTGCLRAQIHGHQPIVAYSNNKQKVDVSCEPTVFDGESITSKANASNPKIGDPCHTLGATGCGRTILIENTNKTYCIQGNCIDRADTAGCNGIGVREGTCYTLNTIDRPAVYDARGNGDGQTAPTITGDHNNRITDYSAICVSQGKSNVFALDRASFNQGKNAQYDFDISDNGINSTLVSKGPSAVANEIDHHLTVRRLTPLECERLQGFPDGWTDIGEWIDSKGKVHKESTDSARYKALGNSIAIPPWRYVLSRLSIYCIEKTMASLFDGIGGFPLIWEELHGKGSCLWASEIEEFPIAITKKHFGE